ncbi:CPBP family intramembrane metalloprotease [Nocardia farcinica]|nr:CPBP family intramembrane metalloprotease [Nocardia farcinica]MBF6265567.1 CPBP family intramembrane metalloprotease [Nocardia farcinica]MBF6284151.1 CPBP family intramembrane metalloprotease [Nocardia farcinica]MBF6308185.1 CPBP family intramembrane metalloprotease [Nocardia farcinica]MBF6511570.1 CPBP family intramembrane metalloprotease [Nocardia farcinica]
MMAADSPALSSAGESVNGSATTDHPIAGSRPPWSRVFFRGLAAVTLVYPLVYCSSYAVVVGDTPLAFAVAFCFGVLAFGVIGIGAFMVRPRSSMLTETRIVCGLLGFRRPEPARWRRRPLLVWCVVVPVLLAAVHFGLDTVIGTVWHPVSDAEQLRANAERVEILTRNGALSAAVLYPFLVAAVPEEIRYRALVLLTQRAVGACTIPRWVGFLVVAAVAGLSIALFAAAHAEYGPMNLVTSAIGGVIYTGLVLYTRSLWPAISCHGFYDLMAISLTIL